MQLRDRSRKFIGPLADERLLGRDVRGNPSAVTTAFTPGSASALLVSIETMRACACGLRLTLAQIMPGITMSAPNVAAAGHLVDAVRADRAGADDAEVGLVAYVCHATVSPRISAAASSTARITLS